MRHIFMLELKKAFGSRKNRFVVMIYTMLLILFAVSNMVAFSEVRQKEVDRIELIVKAARSKAMVTMEEMGFQKHQAYMESDPTFLDGMMSNLDSTTKFADSYDNIRTAILNNDRQAELVNFNQAAQDFYAAIEDSYARNGPRIINFEQVINFKEWAEWEKVRSEYIQQFVDNDIQYIYKNEMTGFNFIYQTMLQFLPFVILLIAFITICDVFTSDNEVGSYKFLLLQPYSRWKVYGAKLLSAFSICFVQIFTPAILVAIVMGLINGFGSADYPVLFQTETYSGFTPTPNRLYVNLTKGFSFYDFLYFCIRAFTYNGYGYLVENASLGISLFSSPMPYESAFIPHSSLGYMGMVSCILMAMPIYIALLLFAVSVSAVIGVVFQNSSVALACGSVVGALGAAFADPIRDLPLLQRLNPFIYTNPINILNGLGSTTALTGILVLLGVSAVFICIGMFVFSRKDIRC